MIDGKNIQDMNHVKYILDNLRWLVMFYEEQNGELPEYESEEVTFQLAEIDSFIIGSQKLTPTNIAMGDIRLVEYWKYLEGEYSFKELLECLKEYEGEI